MNKKLKAVLLTAGAIVVAVIISACGSKASVVANNLSTEADNFQIPREITFYNGITGQDILVIKGLCSIGSGVSSTDPPHSGGNLAVTCEVGKGKFIKDFLGLSDNVTYVMQQQVGVAVSDAHYLVIWRPSTLIPGISVQ